MGKHDATLKAIFAVPTRGNISWDDIESLFRHLGAELTEGRGSRVRVALNGMRAVFHRPHNKDAHKRMVESVQGFLNRAGVNV
jgi:hypothetical protein